MRQRPAMPQAAASGAQGFRRLQTKRRHHQDFDDACEQGAGIPVVAQAGVGQMLGEGEGEQEETRSFYMAATRATHRSVISFNVKRIGLSKQLSV